MQLFSKCTLPIPNNKNIRCDLCVANMKAVLGEVTKYEHIRQYKCVIARSDSTSG